MKCDVIRVFQIGRNPFTEDGTWVGISRPREMGLILNTEDEVIVKLTGEVDTAEDIDLSTWDSQYFTQNMRNHITVYGDFNDD